MGKVLLPTSFLPSPIVLTSSEPTSTTPQGSPRPHLLPLSLLASKSTIFRRNRLLPIVLCTSIALLILILISPIRFLPRSMTQSPLYLLGLHPQPSIRHEAYTRILPIVEDYDSTKIGIDAFPQWNLGPLPISSWTAWAEFIQIKARVLQNALMPDRVPIKIFPQKIVLSRDAPELSDLMFGVATTAERAGNISHIWSHWLNPQPRRITTTPSCVVLLPQSDFETKSIDLVSKAENLSHILHVDRQLPMCQVIGTQSRHSSRYEVRYFALVKEMDRIARSNLRSPKWYVIGDDDTVWLDERMLRRELSNYDPDQKWFLGTTTEAMAQLNTFGNMAYGGAGMMLSRGLFQEMVRIHDECIEENKDVFGGDEIYSRCAAWAMGNGATKDTVLTHVDSLHQMDVPGDGTGIFQSGLPFMSLHHMWHGWTDAFAWDHPTCFDLPDNDLNQLLLLLKAARFLGGDNLFRRSVHGNGSQLVNLGYSITIFDKPLMPNDMSSVEYTWSYEGYEMRYPSRAQIRETDEVGTGGKRTYYLSDVSISPDGTSATFVHLDRWRNRLDLIWGDPPRRKKPRISSRWA